MFRKEYAPFVVTAMVLMTMQPLLTTASKVDGKYPYLQALPLTLSHPSLLSLP